MLYANEKLHQCKTLFGSPQVQTQVFILHVVPRITGEILTFYLQQEWNWRKRLQNSQSKKILTQPMAGLVQLLLLQGCNHLSHLFEERQDFCISGYISFYNGGNKSLTTVLTYTEVLFASYKVY